jgi:hypothetical protein
VVYDIECSTYEGHHATPHQGLESQSAETELNQRGWTGSARENAYIAAQESRLLAIITPGGFEQIVYAVKDTPPDEIADLAARFGCDILGSPVAGMTVQLTRSGVDWPSHY